MYAVEKTLSCDSQSIAYVPLFLIDSSVFDGCGVEGCHAHSTRTYHVTSRESYLMQQSPAYLRTCKQMVSVEFSSPDLATYDNIML